VLLLPSNHRATARARVSAIPIEPCAEATNTRRMDSMEGHQCLHGRALPVRKNDAPGCRIRLPRQVRPLRTGVRVQRQYRATSALLRACRDNRSGSNLTIRTPASGRDSKCCRAWSAALVDAAASTSADDPVSSAPSAPVLLPTAF